ncbi:MAG TPA: SDR family oxidoreductase [Streptosporangiaceae bacterium]
MNTYAGKLAVVTGGGSGMGRELVRQLAARGCSVATCDWRDLPEWHEAPITNHRCDVSDEAQVRRFRDEVLAAHASDHVDFFFNNAGIGGGGSFVTGSREEWERTFAVDWWGVYHCTRAFLPPLIASGDGVLVNTSSVNGFWASLGPGHPNTAYSTAKFAVKGFTEALVEDLRVHAPQLRVVLVLPGHVGTDIVGNSLRFHGLGELAEINDAFRESAPVSAAQAATIILDGIAAGAWRILVGEDAALIDAHVRAKPDAAYDWLCL